MTDTHPTGTRKKDTATSGLGRRVLYLRTFKDPAADIAVLGHLAAALAPDDRIVLLGDARDEATLLPACGGRGELVPTTDADWPRAVHVAMVSTDAVVLHLSPKDLTFPRISRPPDLRSRFPRELWDEGPDAVPGHRDRFFAAIRDFEKLRADAFDRTPLGRLPTGAGLLRELAYLDRLGRLERTVAVADNRHFLHICRRVDEAAISMADGTTIAGKHITARLTTLERQLRLLRDVRGVTFSAPPDGIRSLDFSRALKATLGEARGGRPAVTPEEREFAVANLPLGRSPEPRPLFPDGELKVIDHTPVEDLMELPIGEITEVAPQDVRRSLTADVIDAGCPRCHGPLHRVFFYTHGLEAPGKGADLIDAGTHGRCQTCGRRSTLWDEGRLAAF